MKSQLRSTHGFTLIEIIVALAILSIMTVLTAGAIQNAVRSREKISGVISRESTVRDALRVIERDINEAFHYRDYNADLMEALQSSGSGASSGSGVSGGSYAAYQQQQQAPPTQPGQPPNPLADYKRPPQLTQFIGEKDRLDFTTLSHVRTGQDAPESDQAEIGYYLATCRARKEKSPESNCLWRRQALLIDDKPTKGGEASVLIENVETFNLRYLGPGKENWQDMWKTDSGGDDVTKDKFPYAVEVTLKVHNKNDPNAKPVSMTMVAEVRFPNNKKPSSSGSNSSTNQPSTQTGPSATSSGVGH